MNTLGNSQDSGSRLNSNEARRAPADATELPSNGVPGGASEIIIEAAPWTASALQEFYIWFGKSHAINPDGTPAVVYRGEHGTPPRNQQFHSRLNSLSFCDDPAVASTYAMHPNAPKDVAHAPRVSPVHLKIEKPIINNREDPFIDLAHIEKELGRTEAMRIARKFSKNIEYTGNWDENYADKYASVADLLKRQPQELKKLYFDTFKYLDDPKEVALLQKKGYDGAIHIGNGETSTSTEYRIFDLSQVRSAITGFGGGCSPAGSVVADAA